MSACATQSTVAELEPGLYALTMQASSPATAARLGVDRARRHCAERQGGFEAVRTEIGVTDYRIAFRCPRPIPNLLISPNIGVDPPGVRPAGGLF